jgi:ribosomal subunit interface protein
MDIIFKGRHTSVPGRFRRHAAGKIARLEKLDHKAIRVDVEVCSERNPRQADRRERVELAIRSRGPAIRAEASADDLYVALDLALAKLEARLRKACERRKARHSDVSIRSAEVLAAVADAPAPRHLPTLRQLRTPRHLSAPRDEAESIPSGQENADESVPGLVPIQMEGDGPLVVREKVHPSTPMTIDQALLEMELVGHDFYAFHDSGCGKFSVVYRRRGYDYGVIRLVEEREGRRDE